MKWAPALLFGAVLLCTACGGSVTTPANEDDNGTEPPDPLPAVALIFSTQPNDIHAGNALTTVVTAVDQNGSLTSSYAEPITIGLGLNPGNDELNGTLTVTPSQGRAVFDDLFLVEAAENYQLQANSGSLLQATSAPFRVWPGPVHLLRVNPSALSLTFPTGAISAQLQAVQFDEFGNPTQEDLLWSSDDPTKATVNQEGTVTGNGGFTLVRVLADAMETTVPVITSCVQPRCTPDLQVGPASDGVQGEVLSPALEVETAYPDPAWVNVHLGVNAPGATLAGTLRKRTDEFGRVQFADLVVDKPGTYTILVWAERDGGGVFGETASFVVEAAG